VARLSLYQMIVAVAALIGVTILGVSGNVDSDGVLAIYSAVIGAGLASAGTIANGHVEERRRTRSVDK